MSVSGIIESEQNIDRRNAFALRPQDVAYWTLNVMKME
jgi:hypothetical protein